MTTKHLVTGATGQLGTLVLAALDGTLPKSETAVLVRKDEDRARLAAAGYDARVADYNDSTALEAAFTGIERILLISSSEVGQRLPQHTNVVGAAKAAGARFIAYTSILSADKSPMALATEHAATERVVSASGLDHTFLRNGWYTENITMTLAQDVALGQHFGAAGDGEFATATRADFAAAAAVVLVGSGHEGKVYELAGDTAFTLSDYARTASKVTGSPIAYVDMPQDDYKQALVGAGLPQGLAEILADSDAKARDGWLNNASGDLSRLIGRPTETLKTTLKATKTS